MEYINTEELKAAIKQVVNAKPDINEVIGFLLDLAIFLRRNKGEKETAITEKYDNKIISI